MEQITLPGSDLRVSRFLYGCMRLGGSWDGTGPTPEALRSGLVSLHAALDAGINFFDHADIYCRGASERLFAEFLRQNPGLRDRIVIQSKCGIRIAGDPRPGAPGRYDFSREHILASVDGILSRLGTPHLDILLLHRPDPLMEPEEVAAAFDQVLASGKVRYFGVSNFSGHQIELLKTFVRQPLVANQLQISLLHSGLIDAGTAVNQRKPAFHHPGEGTLEYCRARAIPIQAWSPVDSGRLIGKPIAETDEPRVRDTAALVAEIAKANGATPDAIVLAWLLRHPARIQPVIGTLNPARIRSAVQAPGVVLDREEWYRLYTSARGERVA